MIPSIVAFVVRHKAFRGLKLERLQARYFCKGYNLALPFSMSEYLLIQLVLKIWHIWNSDSNSTYEPVSWEANLIKQIFLSDCYSFVRIVNFVFRSVKRSKHSKFQLISQKMVWIVLLQRFSFALPSNMSKNVFLLKTCPTVWYLWELRFKLCI